MRGEGTTILKYHNKPTKHAEPQINTSEGFISRLSFTPASPLLSPFRTKIISFRAPLHRVKEKVNISVGEAFTRIRLSISYLRRFLTQIQNTTTFTRITLLINRLPPKGEEVKVKNRKTPDAYAREERREEKKKTREDLKGSRQVLFWNGGLSKYTISNPHSTHKTSLYRVAYNIENRFERVSSSNL